MLSKSIEEQARNSVKRKFLPLRVWERKGYDIEDIKQRGKYEWNPEIGHTYGIGLHSEERAKIESLARSQVLQLEESQAALKSLKALDELDPGRSGKAPKKQRRQLEDSERAMPLMNDEGMGAEDEEDSEEESSSSEEEDSDEDLLPRELAKKPRAGKGLDEAKTLQRRAKKLSAKARKQDRKQAQQRQRVAREQQQADREKKALQGRVRALASKVLAKVGPHLEALQEVVQNQHFPSLPKIAQAKCHQYMEQMRVWEADANSTLDDKSATSSALNLEAVGEACKAANVVRSSVSALLKTVSKF